MSSRTELYDDVVDVTSLSALDGVEIHIASSSSLRLWCNDVFENLDDPDRRRMRKKEPGGGDDACTAPVFTQKLEAQGWLSSSSSWSASDVV